MKAIAVFPGRREVKLIEQEPPTLGAPTDVKLRMLDVGVCGTDREICAFQYGTPPAGSDHLVIGHESLGEVVEVGPAVSRVRPGDLVITMVRRPCPHADCVACRAGRQDFCFTGDFSERGIKGLDGFMTETVVDDERYMHVVPRTLRDVGVLVEPLTIAEKALIQVGQVQQRLPWACGTDPRTQRRFRHRAVVLGAGPVGLLGAMALVAADVIMRNLVLKNQVVFGTVNAGQEAFEASIRDLTVFQQRWPAAVQALITGRYPVEAYRDLLVGPVQGIKNVLTFT